MTGSTSVATIVNPNSASGKTGRSWKRIHGRLEDVCGPVTVYETKAPGHAIELAAEAIDSDHRTLIVVGGDGTVNEVVNGILLKDESPASGITVGLIPQGPVRTSDGPFASRSTSKLPSRRCRVEPPPASM